MVNGFHSDCHEKMQSEIAIHSFLHCIEIHGPCQTLLIFLICFLSLSWRHGPQKWNTTKVKRLEKEIFENL